MEMTLRLTWRLEVVLNPIKWHKDFYGLCFADLLLLGPQPVTAFIIGESQLVYLDSKCQKNVEKMPITAQGDIFQFFQSFNAFSFLQTTVQILKVFNVRSYRMQKSRRLLQVTD